MVDVADAYLIEGLQSLSMAEFKKSITCVQDNCTLLRSIIDIYSLQCESSQGFRDIVAEYVRDRLTRGLDPRAKEVLGEITGQIPSFTKDLLDSLLKKGISGVCSHCGYDNWFR